MISIFHSRPRHLADHIRNAIAKGELSEPLPGIRAWSKSFGVSSRTLQVALKMLQREGLLVIQPRKAIRLKQARRLARKNGNGVKPIVRALYYGREYPKWAFPSLPILTEQLKSHGVEMTTERCTHARLKAISQNPLPHELLLLCSVPAAYHRYFADMPRNVLIAGHPSPGSPLSSITTDLEGAVRHAARSLMRRGFSEISLIIDRGKSHGVVEVIEVFHKTCTEWSHQPIHANTVQISTDLDAMLVSARRFAARVKTRRGILVIEPISVSLILTALLERGIAIPRDAEIIGLSTSPDSIKVCPRPIHYPYPVMATVRSLMDTVLRFFEKGALPRIQKKILMEVVPSV